MSAELQKAIYNAIAAANIYGVTEIRDTPIVAPSSANFPFIEIADSQIIPADAGGDTGIDEYIDIHTWSRSGGKREVKSIMGGIYTALHHQTLAVSGRATAYCWLDSARVMNDPDGLTRHGVQTFKVTHRQ